MVHFRFARFGGGECYLRFDDTKPSGRQGSFLIAVEEIVSWLEFKPVRVTSSSDNSLGLYELAEDLINRGRTDILHCASRFLTLCYFNTSGVRVLRSLVVPGIDLKLYLEAEDVDQGSGGEGKNLDTPVHSVSALSPRLWPSFKQWEIENIDHRRLSFG
jgi:hypothetical protein